MFIASGVFAAMHGYPLAGTLMILVFGLVMGTSYQANGKIPRLVIAHTLWNVGVTCAGASLGLRRGRREEKSMSEDPHHVLDLLVDHELALKQLYLAYAAAFADVGDFWRTLAEEEQGHADKLSGLRTDPAVDQLAHGRFQAQASGDRVISRVCPRSRRQGCRMGGITLLQALVVAKDMEEALIDRQWLLPSSPECAEIARVLSELKADTERHRRLVADALDTEKRLHS